MSSPDRAPWLRRGVRGVRRRLAHALQPPGPPAPPARPPGPEHPRRRARRHQYVVVVTYGRSGSTLVQGLLNTIPRTLVRGEHSFWLVHLFRAYDQLKSFRALHLAHAPMASHSAFYGLREVRPRAFLRSAQTLLLDSLLGDVDPAEVDVLGFKEVAWHRLREPEIEPFFDFLDALMPGCRYVLHERNTDDVRTSGFWKGADGVEGKIQRVEHVQRVLRDTRPDRVLDLHFSRLTSEDPAVSDAELRALAELAHGSCDDELLAALRETRKVGHGPYPFGASRADRPEVSS